MEGESALVDHSSVAEAAVIGKQHEIMVRLAHHDPEALEGSKVRRSAPSSSFLAGLWGARWAGDNPSKASHINPFIYLWQGGRAVDGVIITRARADLYRKGG